MSLDGSDLISALSLRNLGELCASAVKSFPTKFTTETPRTLRRRREISKLGHYRLDRKRLPFWLAPFRHAVWLFPIAYTLHVLEELPHFTTWAQRYANAGFTMRDYLTIHLTGIVVALMTPLLVRHFPNRFVIFFFFTFVFTPAAFFNIIFHAAATVVFGAYSPGLLTAMTIYPITFFVISRQAFRERLMSNCVASISFVLAGLFHAADVAHNVFKVL